MNLFFGARELYYTIYFLFGLSFVSCIIVWNSNLHKDPRFTTILSLLTALTIFFTSFAIIIQLYTFHAQQVDSEIQIYDTMFTNLFRDVENIFKNYPKINYLYDEIFKPINYTYKPPSKRYYTDELKATHIILQDLAALVFFLQNDRNLSQIDSNAIKYKINMIISALVSSPTFLENYRHIKPKLFSPVLRDYIQNNFNV